MKTASLEEFQAEAKRFAGTLVPSALGARVVALSGDLGAGKTTFVQSLAKEFGVEEQVNSPTFVIEKIYTLTDKPFKHFIHIDAYRLSGAHELETIGWHDIVGDALNLVCIEWPENVAGVLPVDVTTVRLSGSGEERTIEYGE